MKKKWLIIVASVLILSTICVFMTSCDKTDYVKVSALKGTNVTNEYYGPATAVRLNTDGYEITDRSIESNYAVFSRQTMTSEGYEVSYYMIDLSQNKVLYTGKERPCFLRLQTGSLIWGDVYYTVVTDDEGKVSVTFYAADRIIADGVSPDGLLDYNGRVISSRYSEVNGLDIGGGKVIAEQDGSYSVKDKQYFISDPFTENETLELENYRIYFYPESSGFAVLDKKAYTTVRNVAFSSITGSAASQSKKTTAVLLPDDKILVQEIIYLPANTTKGYDFYNGDDYGKVNTFVYDVEKDKTDTVKNCGYLFGYGTYNGADASLCIVADITEDKTVGESYLQAFDENLNIATDIQRILPGAKSVSFYGEYTIFRSEDRTVIYKGDNQAIDVITEKFDVMSYLGADIFSSVDNSVLFNVDGTYITSLEELGAEEFICLEYAKNHILYLKTETDEASGESGTYVYSLDRNSGERVKIAEASDVQTLNYGFVSVRDAESQTYAVYDVVTMTKLIDGLASGNCTLYEFEDGVLLEGQIKNAETDAYEKVRYSLKRS